MTSVRTEQAPLAWCSNTTVPKPSPLTNYLGNGVRDNIELIFLRDMENVSILQISDTKMGTEFLV